jgi:hypothetical protein
MDQQEQQDQRDQDRLRRAERVRGLADELRPAVQAVRVASPDPDEVWAGTVINMADSLGLDLLDKGQLGAAIAVTELVLEQAGYER